MVTNNNLNCRVENSTSVTLAPAGAELLSIGYSDGEFGIFPLRKGVYLDLNAGAYLVFLGKKLETSPYYERIQLIDPF